MTNYTAADLTGQTVKALNVIARDLGMKRYSALRKAALIAAIIDFTAPEIELTPILDTENPADAPAIRKIMAAAAPVAFSEAPVKAPESVATASDDATEDEPTTEELVEAYTRMRATYRVARGITQVKIGVRLRELSRTLRSLKVNMREV